MLCILKKKKTNRIQNELGFIMSNQHNIIGIDKCTWYQKKMHTISAEKELEIFFSSFTFIFIVRLNRG